MEKLNDKGRHQNALNIIVDLIVTDLIAFRQSEADNNLQKYEIAKKKSEILEKNIENIKKKNQGIIKATSDISAMLSTISTAASFLDQPEPTSVTLSFFIF